MGASRLTAALDRIDRALARIESAAEARPRSSAAAADPAAEESHRALRGKVEEAIARIDGLLAEAEQG